MDVALRSRHITVPQYTALTVLEQHDDMSAAQLARHTFVTAQAMDGVVGALQNAGLIVRHRDPENRRRLVISLTAEGRALLEDCREDIDRIEAVAFAALTTRAALSAERVVEREPAGTGCGGPERDLAMINFLD